MKDEWIDIAMCWDGITPTADLIIDDRVATGDPIEIRRIFDDLDDLRKKAMSLERQLARVRETLHRAEREADR